MTSLLSRLRRHRGLWVLAVLVLAFKLGSSTVCLGDALPVALPAGAGAVVAAAPADVPAFGGCLLGEAGDCHCTCAHTLPVPATAHALAAVVQTPAGASMPPPVGVLAARIDLPLRPPIA